MAGALEHVRILENENFHNIVISVKSTDVPMMVRANRMLHDKVDYPLHLGVTEAGTLYRGTIKSAVGIGALLLDGIGDTIRVSLTDDPVKEVKAAKEILSSVGLQQYGPVLVSCPTCGRTQVNLIEMAQEVEKRLEKFKSLSVWQSWGVQSMVLEKQERQILELPEARGQDCSFARKVIRSVPEPELIDALMEEIEKYENEGE